MPGHAHAYIEPIQSLLFAQRLSNEEQIHSKQFNSHFIVMKTSFRASFNQCQPSEGQGMIKKRIFSHIDGRQYAKSQNWKFSRKNGICHQLTFTMM